MEDVKLLGLKYDQFSHTSDYFDVMLDYCTELIKQGKAYVDDTDAETMKKEREERIESKCRNNCECGQSYLVDIMLKVAV